MRKFVDEVRIYRFALVKKGDDGTKKVYTDYGFISDGSNISINLEQDRDVDFTFSIFLNTDNTKTEKTDKISLSYQSCFQKVKTQDDIIKKWAEKGEENKKIFDNNFKEYETNREKAIYKKVGKEDIKTIVAFFSNMGVYMSKDKGVWNEICVHTKDRDYLGICTTATVRINNINDESVPNSLLIIIKCYYLGFIDNKGIFRAPSDVKKFRSADALIDELYTYNSIYSYNNYNNAAPPPLPAGNMSKTAAMQYFNQYAKGRGNEKPNDKKAGKDLIGLHLSRKYNSKGESKKDKGKGKGKGEGKGEFKAYRFKGGGRRRSSKLGFIEGAFSKANTLKYDSD